MIDEFERIWKDGLIKMLFLKILGGLNKTAVNLSFIFIHQWLGPGPRLELAAFSSPDVPDNRLGNARSSLCTRAAR
jgi:hypothetical protein